MMVGEDQVYLKMQKTRLIEAAILIIIGKIIIT